LARKGKAIISGLDIGTSGMVVLTVDGTRDVHTPAGIGRRPSLGMRKGLVVDEQSAARAIRCAADDAGAAAGIRVDTAWVGFSGCGMKVVQRRVGMILQRAADISDINNLINLARQVELPEEREILQVVPVEFILDGVLGVKNPLGRYAARLEIVASVVTVDSASLTRLLSAVQKAGIRVAGLSVNALTAGEAVLHSVEKELGVALVDLGGGTTGVTVFNDGNFIDAEVLPVGGDHITSDLAIGLRVSLTEAEEIKRLSGLSSYAGLVKADGGRFTAADCRKIVEIIQLRVQEMLDLIRRTIDRLSAGRSLTAGAVLTGGGALLGGLPEMTARVLGLPVRVGVPDFPSPLNGPDLAAAWGLAGYARRALFREQYGPVSAAWGREIKSGLLK